VWPFKEKPKKAPPRIDVDGTIVEWDAYGENWTFTRDGMAFTVDSGAFDPRLVGAAAQARDVLMSLDAEVRMEIAKQLDGWTDSPAPAELLSVRIEKWLSDEELGADYIGENWGDLGVTVWIRQGKVTGSDAGD
jgi:hypothetical protein